MFLGHGRIHRQQSAVCKGCENFQITGQRLKKEFIESLAEIKKACAICNYNVGQLDPETTV